MFWAWKKASVFLLTVGLFKGCSDKRFNSPEKEILVQSSSGKGTLNSRGSFSSCHSPTRP